MVVKMGGRDLSTLLERDSVSLGDELDLGGEGGSEGAGLPGFCSSSWWSGVGAAHRERDQLGVAEV